MKSERRNYVSKVNRLVVKVGSSLLTKAGGKGIAVPFLRHLAAQVKYLQDKGIECVIVTSGAIAAGMAELRLKKRPRKLPELQALAAIGQSKLMHYYESVFGRSGLKVAQILLTSEDLSDRGRYSNARNTFKELSRKGVVPIVNENDTVAVEEIKFGNNDTLGVLVTHLVEADLLVLLTDLDGLFTEDPRINPGAELIHEVAAIDGRIERSSSSSRSGIGTGGMKTKILAARYMMTSGIPMAIANGNAPKVIQRLMKGEPIGTFFYPSSRNMSSRKRWMAWGVKPKGEISVDDGAKRALLDGHGGLLPDGIQSISGLWSKGAVVKIVDDRRREIAKGVVNYSSVDLQRILGLKSAEISRKFGYENVPEVVHRDNLVRIENP